MDAEKKITQARVALLIDHPFYGYLAMKLLLREKADMKPPTMGTDGKHLYFHPEFVENTSLPELMGVICHELCHCFLNHLPRRQNRLAKRWNVAADYAVNDLVLKEFPLPKSVLHDPVWENKHVEHIYNNLPADKDGSETLDSHEGWGDWNKDGGDGDGDGDGEGMEESWQEAVAQSGNNARMRGKLPAHIKELIGDILQPKLDWKTILREMITSCAKNDFKLSPPNMKHLYRGIYLPGITGEEITIAVAIDTSGSISDHEMKEFLGEVKGICDTYAEYTIYLYTCDAAINQKWELHPMDPLPTVLEGRGGTDFRPVFEELEKHSLEGITSLVYLTDLYGPFPDKEPYGYSTIWVATSDQEAPFGTVIRYQSMKD